MEGLSSSKDSRSEIKYGHIQDDEGSDCSNIIVQRREHRSRYWLQIVLFSLNCFALIALLITTFQLRRSQSNLHGNTNDVGSNLLRDDDLSIINRIATPYHYWETGYDDDDFIAGDPYWSDMFPGMEP